MGNLITKPDTFEINLTKLQLFQIGLGISTATALSYVFFGPNPKPPPTDTSETSRDFNQGPKPKAVLGLYNFGKTCYLNALLQALASSRHYITYIQKYHQLREICSKDDNNPQFRVTSALSKANLYINRDAWGDEVAMGTEIPKAVLAILRTAVSVPLPLHREQDTHEIFNLLHSAVVEEQKALQARLDFADAVRSIDKDLSFLDYSLLCAAEEATGSRPDDSTDLATWNNPHAGKLAYILKCIQCLATLPMRFEEFNSLSLTLPTIFSPEHGHCVTIEDLINQYFQPTLVHTVDCPTCSTITGKPIKSTFLKRIYLSKFPRSLCLHVNRARWGLGGSNKISKFIPFGINIDKGILKGVEDMFQSETPVGDNTGTGDASGGAPGTSPSEYELTSVICHTGGVTGGHFICYRRGPPKDANTSDKQWYQTSDLCVEKVMEEQVRLQIAYMLFFDRIESEGPAMSPTRSVFGQVQRQLD